MVVLTKVIHRVESPNLKLQSIDLQQRWLRLAKWLAISPGSMVGYGARVGVLHSRSTPEGNSRPESEQNHDGIPVSRRRFRADVAMWSDRRSGDR